MGVMEVQEGIVKVAVHKMKNLAVQVVLLGIFRFIFKSKMKKHMKSINSIAHIPLTILPLICGISLIVYNKNHTVKGGMEPLQTTNLIMVLLEQILTRQTVAEEDMELMMDKKMVHQEGVLMWK